MKPPSVPGLESFKNLVGIKFQLYNGLFTSLPFHRIENTGNLLSLLLNQCEEGYSRGMDPVQIIDSFFARHTEYRNAAERYNLLFRFIQYIERQVVLFDALEDAAFSEVNDINGSGSLKQLGELVKQRQPSADTLSTYSDFSVRLVLTAHPTQFYPGPVLGIINDLSEALGSDRSTDINAYLQQLGKTPFFKKEKPTPYDEAMNLVWYLENVFYVAAGNVMGTMNHFFPLATPPKQSLIQLGFWPGGDRDGNPFVDAAITLKVAASLHHAVVRCYYKDVRHMKRRMTFSGVENLLHDLEIKLHETLYNPVQKQPLRLPDLLENLEEIRNIIIHEHNGLFVQLVEDLIERVRLFGLHFATLDIRQESSVHNRVLEAISEQTGLLPAAYSILQEQEKLQLLMKADGHVETLSHPEPAVSDTVKTIQAMERMQQLYGEAACNRYIISQCNSALHVMEVLALLRFCRHSNPNMNVDIVPLFETIDDLGNAGTIMESLYGNPVYAAHLRHRNSRQTIMLGFSDGTKDGGYFMANWSIYKAKETLTAISRKHAIDVVFFDGRGGPPSRGGGKTHKFYSSMGNNISNKEIQLTVQGQTVSSNFGTITSAGYNMEQLLHAGISNRLFQQHKPTLTDDQDRLLNRLARFSYEKYCSLKEDPAFTEYLAEVSPLKFYSETNIGSRPSRRAGNNTLSLKDLRAIPYVGAWAQLKQNVTGFFGVGTALEKIEEAGAFESMREIYQQSSYFKTLLDNCEMAMTKAYFPLTQYLADDKKYGGLWKQIHEEYERTKKYLLQLSGKSELMSDYPVEKLSISMRERIVLPLLTIQQYALIHLRSDAEAFPENPDNTTFEKLVVRSSFGIINAGRNSA